MKIVLGIAFALAAFYAVAALLVFFNQRRLLYFPTHYEAESPLAPWREDGRLLGFARWVESPRAVWVVAHGNGGQAAHRAYLLDNIDPRDALVVVEYPGFGQRAGSPTRATLDAAVAEAYAAVRRRHPDVPVGLLGESIGSGPVSALAATAPTAPDKVVLLVPFNRLADVAAEQFSWLPTRWLLRDDWDNGAALADYAGPVTIYLAQEDEIIAPHHARRLHARLPGSELIELPGGHNRWEFEGTFTVEPRP